MGQIRPDYKFVGAKSLKKEDFDGQRQTGKIHKDDFAGESD